MRRLAGSGWRARSDRKAPVEGSPRAGPRASAAGSGWRARSDGKTPVEGSPRAGPRASAAGSGWRARSDGKTPVEGSPRAGPKASAAGTPPVERGAGGAAARRRAAGEARSARAARDARVVLRAERVPRREAVGWRTAGPVGREAGPRHFLQIFTGFSVLSGRQREAVVGHSALVVQSATQTRSSGWQISDSDSPCPPSTTGHVRHYRPPSPCPSPPARWAATSSSEAAFPDSSCERLWLIGFRLVRPGH